MDTQQGLQVIQCVKKYPVLYDPKFQRSLMRRQAWVEVAKELNQEVASVQKKWKNIKDQYVKDQGRKLQGKHGSVYFLQMKFMNPYLPSLSSESRIKKKYMNQNHDDYDSPTLSPARSKSLEKMNGLDLILLGLSKLMETYPQELAEAQSSMDEVDQICLLISKVIKDYAQSEPLLANPSISKFLMEQLASTSSQTKNEVRKRPSRLRQLC